MSKVNKAELETARALEDWNYLWLQAEPLVKLAMRRLMEHGELDPEYSSEDLLQTGMLAAGEAVRSWDPAKGAFSTWIMASVKGHLQHHIEAEISGMVGGRESGFEIVSLHDREEEETDGDDEPLETGHETTLAYDHDPETLRDPWIEAERLQAPEVAEKLLVKLEPQERNLICATYGIGQKKITQQAWGRANGVPLRTVERAIKNVLDKLAEDA